MGRGIGPGRRMLAAILGVTLAAVAAAACEPQPTSAQAVERFRAAAVLQQRALFDLAAAEYEAIARESAADPLADRARLQQGVCLFQLQSYAAAADALEPLLADDSALDAAESEQALAYLGLARYNLGHATNADQRNQHLNAAIDALTQQLQKYPNGPLAPQTAFYQAEALYARGRLEEAVSSYQSLLVKLPAHARRGDALYALGVAQQEHQALADAVETFTCFEKEFPQHAARADARARHADALFALAQSQFARGDQLAARDTVETLLAEFPESALVPPTLALLAQLQLASAELMAAEASLDQCLARSTHAEVSRDARMLRAQVRYRRGNFAGTLADATNLLAQEPHCTDALHLRGLAEAGLGRHADAIQSLTQILAIDPHFARADHVLYDLAWAQQAADEPAAATATFVRLAAAYPASPFAAESYFRVGEAHYAAEDFAAAAQSYSKACDATPSPGILDRALHKLAWCSFKRGQFRAAEEVFARQIAAARGTVDPQGPLEPLAADALLMIAECRFQQQQFAQALATFDTASAHKSADESLRAMTCVHAAQSAGKIGEWQRACELADRAVREFPQSRWADEARCERGIALARLGRLDEADRDLTAIAGAQQGLLQLKSELALAQILVERHDNAAAIRMYFKVAYGHGGPAAPASYHPCQAEAIYLAAQVLEDSGRQDAAGKLYQELVDQYPQNQQAALARQSLERILRR